MPENEEHSLMMEVPPEDAQDDTEPIEEIEEQEPPEEDKLEILNGNTKITWKDKDGAEYTKTWNEIQGSTFLKNKYDKWVSDERKPLEDKAAELESFQDWYSKDPIDFAMTQVSEVQKLIDESPYKDYKLELVVKDAEGNYYDAKQLRPYLQKDYSGEPVKEELTHPSVDEDKYTEALQQVDCKPEQADQAEAEYNSRPRYWNAKNPDNGFLAALKATVGNAPEEKKTREQRSPAKPKLIKDAFKDDPEGETKSRLVKHGMVKYG